MHFGKGVYANGTMYVWLFLQAGARIKSAVMKLGGNSYEREEKA